MALSHQLKRQIEQLSPTDIDRLLRMGWEDRTSFEAICHQFQISPNEFVKLMRHFLPGPDFRRWRRRVFLQGRLKNEKLRGLKVTRFKSSRQTDDGLTKGWK